MGPYTVLSVFSARSLLVAFDPVCIMVSSARLSICPLPGSSRIVSHSSLLSLGLGLGLGLITWQLLMGVNELMDKECALKSVLLPCIQSLSYGFLLCFHLILFRCVLSNLVFDKLFVE